MSSFSKKPALSIWIRVFSWQNILVNEIKSKELNKNMLTFFFNLILYVIIQILFVFYLGQQKRLILEYLILFL